MSSRWACDFASSDHLCIKWPPLSILGHDWFADVLHSKIPWKQQSIAGQASWLQQNSKTENVYLYYNFITSTCTFKLPMSNVNKASNMQHKMNMNWLFLDSVKHWLYKQIRFIALLAPFAFSMCWRAKVTTSTELSKPDRTKAFEGYFLENVLPVGRATSSEPWCKTPRKSR